MTCTHTTAVVDYNPKPRPTVLSVSLTVVFQNPKKIGLLE